MKFLSDILVKAGLTVENTFSANAASNTIYAGTGTRLRTEANNLVFERVSSSGTMKMIFAQGTLSPTAKSYIGYSNATLNLILANEYATAGLELRTSDIIRQQIFSNGNTVIGQASPVDAGYKLDVFGTVRISSTTTLTSLAGTGDRMVVANSSGVLSTQAIVNPSAVLPVGGTTGQILAKIDNTNYNTEWIDNYTGTVKHTVKAGVALTKGQAVYVSSADGTNMIVSKASNATESTSSKTMGLIAQNLSTNGTGFVVTEGLLSGIDTSSAQAGDPVWLGTDGNLLFGLANKPYAPNHLVYIGVVTRVQQNNGEIFVNIQNGFELNEIHNVQITSTPSDNTVLAYEASTSLYKMKSIATLLGFTPVTNARTITINGTTFDLTADRSYSVGTHTGSLTSGYVPKATGTTSLADSLVYDAGTAVLIGTQTASSGKFMVYSTTADNHYQAIGSAPSFRFADTITSPTYTGIIGLATATNNFIIGAAAGDMVLSNNTTSSIGNFLFGTGATERMRINASTGNISINSTNNTYKFDVTGTSRFSGQLRLESTITNGTYTYTLPSATGTLALTSALSGYLPLTGGTLTGALTVTSNVTIRPTSGYNAYFQTSGTALRINYLNDALSANVSAAYRATDYSFQDGSGSAILTLASTGAATFSSTVTALNAIINNGVNSTDGIKIIASTTASVMTGGIEFMRTTVTGGSKIEPLRDAAIGGVGLKFLVTANNTAEINATYTNALQILNTGAATFSSSVTATSFNGTTNNIFSVSGTEGMRLTSTGLGIGTTAPAYPLQVRRAGGGGSLGISIDGVGSTDRTVQYFAIQDSASGVGSGHAFYYRGPSSTTDTLGLILDESGRVGIGTGTSGSGRLNILNISANPFLELRSINNIYQVAKITFDENTDKMTIMNNQSYSLSGIAFGTNGTERMFLNVSGNLGIGTSSPNVASGLGLVLNGQAGQTRLAFKNNYTGDTSTDGVQFALIGGSSAFVFQNREADGYFSFETNGNEAMRITSGGAVGIGTTSPTSKLHVEDATVSADNKILVLQSSHASQLTKGTLGFTSSVFSIQASNIAGSANQNISLNPSGGNVGIGTTSPTTNLQVYQTGGAGNNYVEGTIQVGGVNSALGGAFSYAAQSSGFVNITNLNNGGGANARISFGFGAITSGLPANNVMTINQSGNVGIGTTSPQTLLSVETSGTQNTVSPIITSQSLGTTYTGMYSIRDGAGDQRGLLFQVYTANVGLNEKMRITSGGLIFMNNLGGYSGSYADVRYDTSSKELFYQTSSLRYKEDINNLENTLSKINQLRAVRYKDIKTQKYNCGFIAEEVINIIPEVVFKKEVDGELKTEGINYSDFTPFIIKALQEQQAQINDLKSQLNK